MQQESNSLQIIRTLDSVIGEEKLQEEQELARKEAIVRQYLDEQLDSYFCRISMTKADTVLMVTLGNLITLKTNLSEYDHDGLQRVIDRIAFGIEKHFAQDQSTNLFQS